MTATLSASEAGAGAPCVLSAHRLGKRLSGREVVSEASFDVGAGEIVGLLGANGAGKTTTFAMLVGLLRPDRGEVMLGGCEVGALALWQRARRGLAYLPQESTLFAQLSAQDNLRAVAELMPIWRRRGRRAQHEAALALLRRFALEAVAHTPAGRLSGGERRRLELARALLGEPKVLLLDEPFAGVDPIAVAQIQATLAEVSRTGVGVLVTDHNVRETLKMCDRAYLIDRGRIVAAGPPQALVEDPAAKALYFGEGFRL